MQSNKIDLKKEFRYQKGINITSSWIKGLSTRNLMISESWFPSDDFWISPGNSKLFSLNFTSIIEYYNGNPDILALFFLLDIQI